MPNKAQWIGIIGSDKGTILDINKKKIIRTIPKWSGNISKDGKYTLYAPSRYINIEIIFSCIILSVYMIDHIFIKITIHFRGGLELIELKKGVTVKTYISKVAEGVFTVISMFNRTDEYVLYYHSGRKTIRVFRQVYIYDCNKKHEIVKIIVF